MRVDAPGTPTLYIIIVIVYTGYRLHSTIIWCLIYERQRRLFGGKSVQRLDKYRNWPPGHNSILSGFNFATAKLVS